MTDDDGELVETTIQPQLGIPWSVEFSYLEDQEGVLWVDMHIFTVLGDLHFSCPPEFAERMSNSWHTMAVKAKHHVRSPGLEVATVDMSKLVEELRKE